MPFPTEKGTGRLGTTTGVILTGREHNARIWWHRAAGLAGEVTGVDLSSALMPLPPGKPSDGPLLEALPDREDAAARARTVLYWSSGNPWAHGSLITLAFILQVGGAGAAG